MVIKYLEGQSTGVAFTLNETRTIIVTAEAVIPVSGYKEDLIEYTATVKDNIGASLPETFVVDLLFNAIKVIDAQALSIDVYDPATGILTLEFAVPDQPAGGYTVKLSWAEQEI